jgi:hypothetical protein
MPDLFVRWLDDNAFKPAGDLEGYVQHMTGVDANGEEFNTNAFIGDYKSPLLTPWGAAVLKNEAEDAIRGKDPFWPATLLVSARYDSEI